MSATLIIVWAWTLSALVGLTPCFLGLRDAWVDWRVVRAAGVNGRTLATARQGILLHSFLFAKQVVNLSIGIVLLADIGLLRPYWPLGLLAIQITSVVVSVLDRRTRAYLLARTNRRKRNVGPPPGIDERRQG